MENDDRRGGANCRVDKLNGQHVGANEFVNDRYQINHAPRAGARRHKAFVFCAVVVVAVPRLDQRLTKDVVSICVATKEVFIVAHEDNYAQNHSDNQCQQEEPHEKSSVLWCASQDGDCRRGCQRTHG